MIFGRLLQPLSPSGNSFFGIGKQCTTLVLDLRCFTLKHPHPPRLSGPVWQECRPTAQIVIWCLLLAHFTFSFLVQRNVHPDWAARVLLCQFQYEPWQTRTELPNNTVVYSGLTFDLLNTLAEFLNFEWVLLVTCSSVRYYATLQRRRAHDDHRWSFEVQVGNVFVCFVQKPKQRACTALRTVHRNRVLQLRGARGVGRRVGRARRERHVARHDRPGGEPGEPRASSLLTTHDQQAIWTPKIWKLTYWRKR